MSDRLTVAVEVPLVGDPRLKNWAKIVESVDETRSSGYAFGGFFVSAGGIQDVPIGSTLIVYGEKGSRGNPRAEARVYTVNADATLSHEQSAQGKAWARTIRDRVADLVDGPADPVVPSLPWDGSLMQYTDEALTLEIERRAGESPS